MSITANLFADLPPPAADEQITALLSTATVRIERIVSHGHASPPGFWFDQQDAEWVILLAGRALLRFEDEEATTSLGPGDFLRIAARRRHRIEWTDPAQDTVWLAVHHG
jgi:cupin 2 domain-containing protein